MAKHDTVKVARVSFGMNGASFDFVSVRALQREGPFVIHEPLQEDRFGRTRYVVTHVPTGWGIGRFNDLVAARKALQIVAKYPEFKRLRSAENWTRRIERPGAFRTRMKRLKKRLRDMGDLS